MHIIKYPLEFQPLLPINIRPWCVYHYLRDWHKSFRCTESSSIICRIAFRPSVQNYFDSRQYVFLFLSTWNSGIPSAASTQFRIGKRLSNVSACDPPRFGTINSHSLAHPSVHRQNTTLLSKQVFQFLVMVNNERSQILRIINSTNVNDALIAIWHCRLRHYESVSDINNT